MTKGQLSLSCDCAPVFETWFGQERERTPTVAIIEAVAAAEGVAPTELEPLYDEIDTDAVNRLLASDRNSSSSNICIQLSVSGWQVFVRNDGAIRVCDPNRPTAISSPFEMSIAE